MLSIRLQRTGRKDHAMYRLVVQESHRSPLSGRVVAFIGSFDPHTKKFNVKKDDAQKYLDNGAQPTPRTVKLLKEAGIKMPTWVKEADSSKKKNIRNPEKLRKNQPKEAKTAEEPAPKESAEEKPEPETTA